MIRNKLLALIEADTSDWSCPSKEKKCEGNQSPFGNNCGNCAEEILTAYENDVREQAWAELTEQIKILSRDQTSTDFRYPYPVWIDILEQALTIKKLNPGKQYNVFEFAQELMNEVEVHLMSNKTFEIEDETMSLGLLKNCMKRILKKEGWMEDKIRIDQGGGLYDEWKFLR